MELRVNGVVVRLKLSLPPTGSWTTWKSVSVSLDLLAGAQQRLAGDDGLQRPEHGHIDRRLIYPLSWFIRKRRLLRIGSSEQANDRASCRWAALQAAKTFVPGLANVYDNRLGRVVSSVRHTECTGTGIGLQPLPGKLNSVQKKVFVKPSLRARPAIHTERLEDRHLFAAFVVSDVPRLIFNDPVGGAVSASRSVTLRNTGNTKLTIPAGGVTLGGSAAARFRVAPITPVPRASRRAVRFSSRSVSRRLRWVRRGPHWSSRATPPMRPRSVSPCAVWERRVCRARTSPHCSGSWTPIKFR